MSRSIDPASDFSIIESARATTLFDHATDSLAVLGIEESERQRTALLGSRLSGHDPLVKRSWYVPRVSIVVAVNDHPTGGRSNEGRRRHPRL